MDDTNVSIKMNIVQILESGRQGDRFNEVVTARMNDLHIPLKDDEKFVFAILYALEAYFHAEVDSMGGSISAADLTRIITVGVDKIHDGTLIP